MHDEILETTMHDNYMGVGSLLLTWLAPFHYI